MCEVPVSTYAYQHNFLPNFIFAYTIFNEHLLCEKH